ncbi:histidine kinase [Prevotella falsenii]|uniref:histidine kinase n=1 Tax=Prevotella falsenii TaxID=515414 RepID=UPI000468FE46|nr:histidine kinase [Prevotella falsenii]
MEDKEQYSEFARKIMEGVKKAQQKMIREKILKGENIVIADADGKIMNIPAQELAPDE